MALLTVYACPFTKGQGRVYRISYRTHICTVPLIRKSLNSKWQSRGNDRGLTIDDSSFIDDVSIMDDRHEEERHTGTSDSMKFPCGLMCLSFRAAIPLRAFATVQIH